MTSVTVFVCGQPLRGDDGAARAAVMELPPQARLAARIREVGELSVEDLLTLAPGSAAIVVDAVSGVEPGRLVSFELTELRTHAPGLAPRSTHQLPLDQVVGLAELLGADVRGTFIGVGGLDFGFGRPLSEPVRHALPSLRAALAAEIERLGGRVTPPPSRSAV